MSPNSRQRVAAATALLLGAGGAVAEPAPLELWTNAAGHAIVARLVDVRHGSVFLEQPDGSPLSLPLDALSAGTRARLQQDDPVRDLPADVRLAWTDARAVCDRLDRLPAERQTPDSRRQVASAALALFDQRIPSSRLQALTPAQRAFAEAFRRDLLQRGAQPLSPVP